MNKLLTGTAVATGAAALSVAGLLARRYLSLSDAIAAVSPAMRSPLVLLSVENNARTLWFNRIVNGGIPTPLGPGVTATTRAIGDPPVPVLIVTPEGTAHRRPGVLYLHGGGSVFGSAKTEAIVAGRWARDLDAVVVSPDYRLAPENPFPAGLDDCMTALHWMHEHATELGIDPQRLAVTGTSAGAGLSAVVAQRALDEGLTLRAQGLVGPWLDDRTTFGDYGIGEHPARGRLQLTPGTNLFAWTSYLGHAPRADDDRRYIAAARRQDLSGLAPAWVGVGDLDLLYNESIDYAHRLQADGVICELVTVPGMYHSAEGLAPHAPEIQAFLGSATEFLRTHLSS